MLITMYELLQLYSVNFLKMRIQSQTVTINLFSDLNKKELQTTKYEGVEEPTIQCFQNIPNKNALYQVHYC